MADLACEHVVTGRVQQLSLLLFGGALARLASGPELLRYVAPGARIPVAAAGLVIVVVGASSPRGRADAPRLGWLVLVPILAILVIGPPSLGAWTAARSRAAVLPPSTDFDPLPDGPVVALPVSQFVLRSLYDRASTLRARTVRLTGFVTSPHPRRFELTRLVITCCAADAERMSVDVTHAPGTLVLGTWVSVTGRYSGTDRHVPVLQATEVVPTVQPDDPYE